MRRRWRRKTQDEVGSLQLMKAQRKKVLPGSYCHPLVFAAVAGSG